MLDTLISSKTRLKLLLKFFLNTGNEAYLRNLETEFGESTNGIRLELNKFEQAGMICSKKKGNKKIYTANIKHPLYHDIRKIVMKYIGIDQVLEAVVGKIGQLESVFLVGDYARGLDTGTIELVLLGKDIDQSYLHRLIAKAEKMIDRKISCLHYAAASEMHSTGEDWQDSLLLWKKGDEADTNPHMGIAL